MSRKRKKEFTLGKQYAETTADVEVAGATADDVLGHEGEGLAKTGAGVEKYGTATGRHRRHKQPWYGQFMSITPASALLIMIVLGLVTFAWGLNNQFVADDAAQLQNNPLVHSLSHLGELFGGSTFYAEKHPQQPGLAGIYYRPLMLATYAVIYSLFGPNTFAFHLFQLTVYIGCSFLLFLVFRYFFRPVVALVLALVFLVDPINTQNVYYIANLQEPLYFFFGMLGFWTYLKYQDKPIKFLAIPAACMFVALLGKESGILFVAITLLYAWITDKARCKMLAFCYVVPVLAYAIFRFHALGLRVNRITTPIDLLSLPVRLINIPSIVWFYITKAVWPWQLITYYNWAYKTFTLMGFWLPLVGDVLVGLAVWYVARYLRAHRSRRDYMLFWFFALWFAIGLTISLQIVPLDETASDTWFIVSLAGFLGVIGTLIEALNVKAPAKMAFAVLAVVLVSLSWRSALRAQDWYSSYTMAVADVRQSTNDWVSDAVVANELLLQDHYQQSYEMDEKSLHIFPGAYNYAVLAHLLFLNGQYKQAETAYMDSIKDLPIQVVLDQMAELQLYYYTPSSSLKNIQKAIYLFPKDGVLWTSYGLLNYKIGNVYVGQDAIIQAYRIHGTNEYAYDSVMHYRPVNIDLMGHPEVIVPPANAITAPAAQNAQN